MRKIVSLLLAVCMVMAVLSGCAQRQSNTKEDIRSIEDSAGRTVTVPQKVERIVCVGVGALRYTCYMGGANLVVGVEDYETKEGMTRLYQYVNFDKFKNLPVIGPKYKKQIY